MKLTALATAIILVLCGPIIALALLAPILAGAVPTDDPAGCIAEQAASTGVAGLTGPQLERAALIFAVAADSGMGIQGAVVGIAAALQESDLGADPTSRAPNSDGDVGLFQMRTLIGWHADGDTVQDNIAILLDDGYQARVFFLGHTTISGWRIPGLVDIPGWPHLPITEAAQHVQRSAFPDAYARHEATARDVAATLHTRPAGVVVCQAPNPALECPTTPTTVGNEQGLTPDATKVMRCVAAGWPQIRAIGGLRPGDPKDHGTGRAVDVMIPGWTSSAGAAIGEEIAEWAKTNAGALGVTYVIWQRRIWSVARTDEGWRDCARGSCYDGPNPTSAHEDHVHISVHGTNGTGETDTKETSDGAVVLPVAAGSYRITARFGQSGTRWSSLHTGLDFAAPTGTPIHAITAGMVTYTEASGGAYGTLTKIRAADGTESWYAHQSRTGVRVGQHVAAGQVIGSVGATGNVTGAHLHLEIRINAHPTNPRTWLRTQGPDP